VEKLSSLPLEKGSLVKLIEQMFIAYLLWQGFELFNVGPSSPEVDGPLSIIPKKLP
jgi:hypothetical protein